MSDMCSYEHLKMLNRMLTTAFSTLGTNVSWSNVSIKLPLKGRNVDYNRSYFDFTNIFGKLYIPSMSDEEMSDPYGYIDEDINKTLDAGSTRFVNETFKTLGTKTVYGVADINEDLIFSEVLDAIRRAPDSQPSPIMKGYMAKATRDSMFAKASNMGPVINGKEASSIDQTLIAVAINNAKILNLLPEDLISTGELMEIFDKSIFTVMSNTQVRNIFKQQALNSNENGGGVVFLDERLLEAFRKLSERHNINSNEHQFKFGPDEYEGEIEEHDVDDNDDTM